MLEIGRVKGHRGTDGEMTVLIHEGEAAEWESLDRIWLSHRDDEPRPFGIVSRRAYRNRLVLRIEGVDDGNAAAQLRGARVLIPLEQAPLTDDDVWYHAELEGMQVFDEAGLRIGSVRRVVATGGTDLLSVAADLDQSDDGDVLIPLTRSIVLEVRQDDRTIVVRPPEGLLELNVVDRRAPDPGAET